MKKLNLISLLFFISIESFSQEKNYKITYRHCLQLDTLKKLNDTIGIMATLIGNSKESNYTFGKIPKGYIMPKNEPSFSDILNSKDKSNRTVAIRASGTIPYDSIGNMVYHDKQKQITSVRDKSSSQYLITQESSPKINWEITNEKRVIKNYTCQQAVCYYRGRYYIAWFTTDIPVIAAPWKFNGLPGLLMDIEDIKHQVKIYVESIELPTSDKVPKFINKGNKISLEKYFTIWEEEKQKRLKAMLTMMENQNPNIPKPENIKFSAKATDVTYGIEIRIN